MARLDERRLAFGGGTEPAQVPRLDADRLQLDERAQHAERLVAVVLGRGQRATPRRRRRAAADVAPASRDQLVAAQAAGGCEECDGAVAPARQRGRLARVDRLEVPRMTLSGR